MGPFQSQQQLSDSMSLSWGPCSKRPVNKAAQDAEYSTNVVHAEESFQDFKLQIAFSATEANSLLDQQTFLKNLIGLAGMATLHHTGCGCA